MGLNGEIDAGKGDSFQGCSKLKQVEGGDIVSTVFAFKTICTTSTALYWIIGTMLSLE